MVEDESGEEQRDGVDVVTVAAGNDSVLDEPSSPPPPPSSPSAPTPLRGGEGAVCNALISTWIAFRRRSVCMSNDWAVSVSVYTSNGLG